MNNRAHGHLHHHRPARISRQKAKKEKEREAMKAELLKEIEKELAERGVKPAPAPKALTPAQDMRREELLAEKKELPALFKAAKEKIAEKKVVFSTANGRSHRQRQDVDGDEEGERQQHRTTTRAKRRGRLLVVRAAVFLVVEIEVKRADDGSFHISGGQRAKGLVAAAIGTLQEDECTQVDRPPVSGARGTAAARGGDIIPGPDDEGPDGD
ncbi:hypothetical protein V492_07398 [Pseudogymnoascus sp. VKM F-4246]|nr:hypothetical protein V492_07398 [Pseudogymnoascus sp. VKM F-4246]